MTARRILANLAGLVRRSKAEHDLDDELQAYVQASAEDLMRRGMPRDEAPCAQAAGRSAVSKRSRIALVMRGGNRPPTAAGTTSRTRFGRCARPRRFQR